MGFIFISALDNLWRENSRSVKRLLETKLSLKRRAWPNVFDLLTGISLQFLAKTFDHSLWVNVVVTKTRNLSLSGPLYSPN